jgi:hypothetical protein
MLATLASPIEDFNARSARERWSTVCDETLSFDSSKLAQLADIWRNACGARDIPAREDLTARVLGRHLRNLTFVERETQGRVRRYRFRLFGSGLSEYIGDCTGRYVDEVVPEAHLAGWLASYDLPISLRKPLRYVSRFRPAHLEHIAAETFAAPLSGRAGEAWGLLVSVIYSPVVS